jgi:hypothetical protein
MNGSVFKIPSVGNRRTFFIYPKGDGIVTFTLVEDVITGSMNSDTKISFRSYGRRQHNYLLGVDKQSEKYLRESDN